MTSSTGSVAHRARLFGAGETPHVRQTATPIPRSLAWAIYGELDVSVLDEKPPGRGTVTTRVREESARDRIYRFAAERVRAGERVYVVVPAIEEGEREVAATRETARRIAAETPGVAVATLHGRMPAPERTAVLQDFAAGRVGILVATTVVEVGVDVPEATFMVVENADSGSRSSASCADGLGVRVAARCALVVGPRAGRRRAAPRSRRRPTAGSRRRISRSAARDPLGTRQSGAAPQRSPIRARSASRARAARSSPAGNAGESDRERPF